MGEWIKLKASDGFEFDAWRAAPKGAPRGGLVVVQEIFGVNAHIRSVADGFAADGYLAIAPAIFDRAERGFDVFEDWVTDTVRLLEGCPCERGCPSCVQSPKCGNLNEPLHKAGALRLLGRMLASWSA